MIDFYDLLVIRSALEDYYETLWLDFQLAQCKTALDHVKEEIKTYQDVKKTTRGTLLIERSVSGSVKNIISQKEGEEND